MKYTPEAVAKLVADVELAFTAELANKKSTLAKSEDGEKPAEDKHEEKPEHKEAAPAEGEKPEAKEEGKEEHHEEKPEHEAKEGHEQGHDYDEEDMAHMDKMYRSMSPAEQSAHHSCLQKCMGKTEAKPAEMEKHEKAKDLGTEGHKSGGEMSADAPSKTPGAKSPASKADGEQMEKSENTEVELLKNELAAEKAEKAAIKEFLTALAKKTVPQGKAITSLDVIAKSETPVEVKTPTKSEIHKILMAKDPSKLEKSDRDAINSFYLNGQVNINSISHLLK